MKIYETNEIKNIALIGSKGSGKTTLAEAMLFECGVIKRRGNIEAKNTVCDYFPVEKEYGYSVFSTVCYAEFLNKKLNVIDCPGGDDFVGNAITALNVTDTGVLLVDAQYGVEVGTQNIFRTTEKVQKPVIFALNQLDGDKVDFDNVVQQMKEVFGNKIVLIQYPINPGAGYNAMIDVLLMKMYSWGPDGGVPTISEIPADQMEKAQELNKILIEAAAENDETLMEKFFDKGVLTEDEMREMTFTQRRAIKDAAPTLIPASESDAIVQIYREEKGAAASADQVVTGMQSRDLTLTKADFADLSTELGADYIMYFRVTNTVPTVSVGFMSAGQKTNVTTDFRVWDAAKGNYVFVKRYVTTGSSSSFYAGMGSASNAVKDGLEKALKQISEDKAKIVEVVK